MRILFDHPSPFQLAHGGYAVQIHETKRALESLGIEIEFLRWWDEQQHGDLIHYFGLPSYAYLLQCRKKGLPLVCTHLLTGSCNRPDLALRVQGILFRLLNQLPGWGQIRNQTTWPVIQNLPAFVVGLEAEKKVLQTAFAVPPERIHLVPLGLSEAYLERIPLSPPRTSRHLITTGTITERKRSCELAEMALQAQVPLLFVGKPYSEQDPYWHRFQKLIDHRFVKHHPHVSSIPEMISLLEDANGFVLFSHHENWCLSAHEAAACGLPLLVPDQKWSRERFGSEASYWPVKETRKHADILRDFYECSQGRGRPAIQLFSWNEAAQHLKAIYESALAR